MRRPVPPAIAAESSQLARLDAMLMPPAQKKKKVSSATRYHGKRVLESESLSSMNGVVRLATERFGREAVLGRVLWTEPSRADQAFYELHSGESEKDMHNHIPFLKRALYKRNLFNALNACRRVLPEEYDFYPKSYDIGPENVEFVLQTLFPEAPSSPSSTSASKRPAATYVFKPSVGHQGHGIGLVQNREQALEYVRTSKGCSISCQEYIERPLLLKGFKFDFRVYCLIESVSPLRIHIFREGLARFCTRKYAYPTERNLDNSFMHLTNYSLNKESSAFVKSKSTLTPGTLHSHKDSQAEMFDEAYADASKRSISITLQQIREEGHELDVKMFWNEVDDIVVKSVISIHPRLKKPFYEGRNVERKSNSARTAPLRYFQLLGVDILVDENMKLHLLEINNNPSMLCKRCSLDSCIKQGVFASSLHILGLVDASQPDGWMCPFSSYTPLATESYAGMYRKIERTLQQ